MTVLVLEDEIMIALDLATAFEAASHSVAVFDTARGAHDWLDANHPKAAVVDFKLRDGDSLSLVERLRKAGAPIVIHTGVHQNDARFATEWLLGVRTLPKPCPSQDVVQVIDELLSVRR